MKSISCTLVVILDEIYVQVLSSFELRFCFGEKHYHIRVLGESTVDGHRISVEKRIGKD